MGKWLWRVYDSSAFTALMYLAAMGTAWAIGIGMGAHTACEHPDVCATVQRGP